MRRYDETSIITTERFTPGREKSLLYGVINFGDADNHISIEGKKRWKKVLDSANEIWFGPANDVPAILETGALFTIQSNSIVVYE